MRASMMMFTGWLRTNESSAKKHLPNALTASRFLLTGIFCLFIRSDSFMMASLIFVVICLTDFFDGRLARRWGCQSKTGAVLDAAADLTYVLVSCAFLSNKGLLPAWYLVVLTAKFIEFSVTSRYLRRCFMKSGTFVYDTLGRIASMLFFAIPGVVTVTAGWSDGIAVVATSWILGASVSLAIISSMGRLVLCFNSTQGSVGGLLWTRSN